MTQVHGGGLRAAARHYGIAPEHWLDLSTGINPNGYPLGLPPAVVWARLPESDDGLEAAAARYYGCEGLLPLPGSQAAIQLLPQLRPVAARVGILAPSYNEHARGWRLAGHRVEALPALGEGVQAAIEARLPHLDVLVLVNPNNPTGLRVPVETLLRWHQQLVGRGGWLVVDEAFMDTVPEHSVLTATPDSGPGPGLLVLRSLGKFFGLAGARVGFLSAEPALRAALAERLGPWALSGPARWAATRALEDRAWQEQTRATLTLAGARLEQLLRRCGITTAGGAALFRWVRREDAVVLQDALARQAILVRRFDDPASLRFGLPGDEAQWHRLEQALEAL
ncbi:threonine-phosphate decarboxylase CobD [Thioalkalivibrio sp. ALJT]|uniref:threonine-phosphate decarboxylase CobD n=1 Tax=Thioalkalivibrio sp. ALJT TaxID=1158146 RepID=UPI0009DA840C